MEQQSVNTSDAPEVYVEEVSGSLSVKGWDQAEVSAKADPGSSLILENEADSVRISCRGNCTLHVPLDAALHVEKVNGEARFKRIEEALEIDEVMGELTLIDVAAVNVHNVHGNLQARDISGDVHIEQVHGNATLRRVEGGFFAEQVKGNLELRGVEGVVMADAEGNVTLRLESLTSGSYRVSAKGNLQCRVSADENARVSLTSDGETIELRLPDQNTTLHQKSTSITLGEEGGDTELILSAGGALFFGARPVPWDEAEDSGKPFGFPADFGEQIAQQVQSQVEEHMGLLNDQLSKLSVWIGKANFSEEEAERVMRQARKTTEQATARAQENIARAQEKIARKMEAAQRKAERQARSAERRRSHGSHSWSSEWPSTPPPPAQEPKEPVTDEERLMILRMLEEKKITLEEAEKLLAALEGEGNS